MVDVFINGNTRLLTDQDVPGSSFNLLDGTSNFSNFTTQDGSIDTNVSDMFNNAKSKHLLHLWEPRGSWFYNSPLFLGKGNYTLSFSCRFLGHDDNYNDSIQVFGLMADSKQLTTVKIPNSWGSTVHRKVARLYISNDVLIKQLSFVKQSNTKFAKNSFYVTDLKLESGSIATPYCDSMNDLTDRITALESHLGGVKLRYRLYINDYTTSVKEVA